MGIIQGTFGVVQGIFGVIQGTFEVIQGTFGMQETFVIIWNHSGNIWSPKGNIWSHSGCTRQSQPLTFNEQAPVIFKTQQCGTACFGNVGFRVACFVVRDKVSCVYKTQACNFQYVKHYFPSVELVYEYTSSQLPTRLKTYSARQIHVKRFGCTDTCKRVTRRIRTTHVGYMPCEV